jgi:hypothetical protein
VKENAGVQNAKSLSAHVVTNAQSLLELSIHPEVGLFDVQVDPSTDLRILIYCPVLLDGKYMPKIPVPLFIVR